MVFFKRGNKSLFLIQQGFIVLSTMLVVRSRLYNIFTFLTIQKVLVFIYLLADF